MNVWASKLSKSDFPSNSTRGIEIDLENSYRMSRRDMFAAAALTGLLASQTNGDYYLPNEHHTEYEIAAIEAIKHADSMIAELDKKENEDG